jgi:DNA (cytosine-5)-methyltransferase 1
MTSVDVLDYCAGIGGWTVALRRRGLHSLAIENAKWPRQALLDNDIEIVWDDLTTLPLSLLDRPLAGIVGSFPCQPFSQNIKGTTTADMLRDPRAKLMHIGLGHLLWARPPFVCLENVPRAQVLMRVIADALIAVGYSAEVKVFNTANYGLPQTRKRALLVARKDGLPVAWPEPTHIDEVNGVGGAQGCKPWVTLSEAVGRKFTGLQSWGNTQPAPTVVGSFKPEMHAPPVYRGYGSCSRQNDPGAIELTLDERMMLQGFPKGWKLAGPKTAQDLEIGNSLPPILGEIALTAATALPV